MSGQQSGETAMPPLAVMLALTVFLLFSVLDANAKWLVGLGYATFFVVWVRFALQAVVLFVVYRGWRNRRLWQMNRPLYQVLRGLSLPSMTFFNFLALRHLQLDETVSVLLASPIFVAALAGPFLGEWAGPRRWAAILVGFVGVLIVVRPGTDAFTLPVVFIILSMLSNVAYFLLTRKLAGHETPESLIFYSCFFAVFLFAPFGLPEARLPQSLAEYLAFAAVGLSGMIGHMLLIRTSRLVETAKIAPFIYSQAIWMVAIGYLFYGDVPDVWTFVGMLVICAAGLYLMYRERQTRKAVA